MKMNNNFCEIGAKQSKQLKSKTLLLEPTHSSKIKKNYEKYIKVG